MSARTITPIPPIRRASFAEAGRIASRVASSFMELPLSMWLVPDPAHRAQILRPYFQVIVDSVLSGGGHVDVIDDPELSGVAVWAHEPVTTADGYDYPKLRRDAVSNEVLLPRFEILDDSMAAHHQRVPHDHLLFLAVARNAQNRGLGTALMNHHHTRLDAQNRLAYVEAATPKLSEVYARQGYEPSLPITLHGDLARGIPDLPHAYIPAWRVPSNLPEFRPDQH